MLKWIDCQPPKPEGVGLHAPLWSCTLEGDAWTLKMFAKLKKKIAEEAATTPRSGVRIPRTTSKESITSMGADSGDDFVSTVNNRHSLGWFVKKNIKLILGSLSLAFNLHTFLCIFYSVLCSLTVYCTVMYKCPIYKYLSPSSGPAQILCWLWQCDILLLCIDLSWYIVVS